MADEDDSVELGHATKIRKLRKQLRQIERLERIDRQLTDQEILKVSRKTQIRDVLRYLFLEQQILVKSQQEEKEMDSGEKDDKDDAAEKQQCEKNNDDSLNEQDVVTGDDTTEASDDVTEVSCDVIKSTTDETGSDVTADTSAPEQTEQTNQHLDKVETVKKETAESAKEGKKAGPTTVHQSTEASERQTRKLRTHRDSSLLLEEWQKARFNVRVLEGHHDIIHSVDSAGQWLLSGGRDTMLKLWDCDKGKEVQSFRGHTGSVTAVKLVSKATDCEGDSKKGSHCLALSGSKDCSIKIWDIKTGEMKQSVYTFSAVDCLDQVKDNILSGSDGGKVDLWDLETGQNKNSLRAFEDAVTCVKFQSNMVVGSSRTGQVKIWDMRNSGLHPVLSTDDVIKEDSKPFIKQRPIHCLAATESCVYWGDDGINIKALDITAGKIRKLRNHSNGAGMTYSLATTDSLLVSGSYDLDNGCGFLNVRSLLDEEYLATVDDMCTGAILCLTCSENQTDNGVLHRWATGGSDLKIWEQLPTQKIKKRTKMDGDSCVTANHLSLYSESHISDTESSDYDTDDDGDLSQRYDSSDEEADEMVSGPGSSWCTIQ